MSPIDVLPPRPYPGLRAFEPEEWAVFFGREEHADEVICRLGVHHLVLVHGASGCGKSSLVRAGVLPTLETNHQVAGRRWRSAVMRPSEGLLDRLAEILDTELPVARAADGKAAEGGDGGEGAKEEARRLDWADLVVKGGGLVDYIEEAIARSGGGSFCLIVDQFEEIFRWARERSDAEVRLFIEFLQRVGGNTEEGGLYVILTMRSDYFGACATYQGFAEFLNPRQFLLPRMDEFGLLRSIHEPAELYHGSVDVAVASELLPVVKVHLDGLPVLQHALMRASDHARARCGEGRPWVVTLADLAAIGGAGRALAQHAEEVLARATQGDERLVEAAEWMFRALTDLDADRRAIRRPCRLAELVEVSGVDRKKAMAILEHFRAPDCSFVSPYLPAALDDEDELDISHEALIRQWPRLCDPGVDRASVPKGCVYREFHDGLIWRSLAVQAEGFAANSKNLLSAATTEQRLPWFRTIEQRPGWTRRHALTDKRGDETTVQRQWQNVSAMMEASAKNLAREQMLTRRLRRSRNASLACLAVAVLSLMLSFYYYLGMREAWKETDRQYLALRGMVRPLIEQSCRQYYPAGSPDMQFCVNTLEQTYNESLEFTLGRRTQAQAQLSSKAGLSRDPRPSSAAPNNGRR